MMNINLFILNNGQALLNIPVNNIKHNINLNVLHLPIASQYRVRTTRIILIVINSK